jgi:hypothetical protein
MEIDLGDYNLEIDYLYCGRKEYTELVYPKQGNDKNKLIKITYLGYTPPNIKRLPRLTQ